MKSPRSPSASAGLFICGECCVARVRARRGSVASPRLRAWTSLARGSESHQPPLHEKPAVALRRLEALISARRDSLAMRLARASKLRNRLRALKHDVSQPVAIHSRRGWPERASCEAGCERSDTSAERSEAREDDAWRRCASRVASPLVMAKLGRDARLFDVRSVRST